MIGVFDITALNSTIWLPSHIWLQEYNFFIIMQNHTKEYIAYITIKHNKKMK